MASEAAALREAINQGLSEMVLASSSTGCRGLSSKIAVVGNTVMQHLMLAFRSSSSRWRRTCPTRWRSRRGARRSWAGTFQWTCRCASCQPGRLRGQRYPRRHPGDAHPGERRSGRLRRSGTNGEIVAAAARVIVFHGAGPAFEGTHRDGDARGQGAISRVSLVDGRMEAQVIGAERPRHLWQRVGGRRRGRPGARPDQPTGRITEGDRMVIQEPVAITQRDVRELQLAKAAIAAGLRILFEELGKTEEDVQRFYLAGAFGNTLGVTSAERIGLFRFGSERTIRWAMPRCVARDRPPLPRGQGVPAGIRSGSVPQSVCPARFRALRRGDAARSRADVGGRPVGVADHSRLERR